MRTIALTIAYAGTDFVGWQMQPNGVSIQGCVQEAVKRLTGEAVPVVAAGRTDAGVHALGQVAHLRTTSSIPAEGFVGGCNRFLPEAIAIVDARDAPEGFHAQRDAIGKRYRYRILEQRGRAPLARNRCWIVPGLLDREAMEAGADVLIGAHDFESFRAAGCTAEHARRTITRLSIEERAPAELGLAATGRVIDCVVEGDGFVRHMIRNIAGTLVEVGEGKRAPEEVGRILAARARTAAGICAPACGLTLERVFYPE